MLESTAILIAFSGAFSLIGLGGTILRRRSTADRKLAAELLGWGFPIATVAWLALIEVAEQLFSAAVLQSWIGVLLFGGVLNLLTLYLASKVWHYYDPVLLIGAGDTPTDSKQAGRQQ